MSEYTTDELKNLYASLDAGIREQVEVLMSNGLETYESCEGGRDHAYPEPTVRFHGERSEGWRALSVALSAGLKVKAIKRLWTINDGEPSGAYWEMVFTPNKPRSAS